MSDVVVIPQKKCNASAGQLPAKVFDAMAMAKPIIATSVSDLPAILRDCGWLVDPENVGELAMSIKYVLEHPDEGKTMGCKARKKCIEMYSYDAMERPLCDIFKVYE
jgi:glycosyltransferase involved in cell wall biosynthesis